MKSTATIFFVLFVFFSNSQSIKELNDAAFKAYEENDANAVALADSFFNSSLSDTLSVFHINSLTLLGIHSKNQGHLVTSINYYLKALNAAQQTNDKGRESAILNNLGSIYQLQSNYHKALEYFKKSLELEVELDNPLQKSIRYFNVAEIYRQVDSLELAISNYNQSLILEKKQQNIEGEIYAKVGLAQVYLKMKRFQDVLIAIEEIDPFIGQCSSELKINYLILKGKYYFENNELDNSINNLVQAISIAKRDQYNSLLLEGYELLAKAFEKEGEIEKSNQYLKEYIHLNKQLNDVQIKNQLEDLLHQNEIKKKEMEISMVKEERDLVAKNIEIEKELNTYQMRVILLILFSIITLVVLLIIRLRK